MPPRTRKTTKEPPKMTTVQEPTETGRKYKDLSPEALGITEQNFEDFAGELPKQSSANAKYQVYYDQLMDSYERSVAKRVTDIESPQDLVNALRNAASNNGIGIDTRIVFERTDNHPDGEDVVYFQGREKRAKRSASNV